MDKEANTFGKSLEDPSGHPLQDAIQEGGLRTVLETMIRRHPLLTILSVAIFAYLINKLYYKMDEWRNPAPSGNRPEHVAKDWDEQRKQARLRQQAEYEATVAEENDYQAQRKMDEAQRKATAMPNTVQAASGRFASTDATEAKPTGPKQPKNHDRSEYNPLMGSSGSCSFRPKGFERKRGG